MLKIKKSIGTSIYISNNKPTKLIMTTVTVKAEPILKPNEITLFRFAYMVSKFFRHLHSEKFTDYRNDYVCSPDATCKT
jgi:hypothetical protein